MCCDSAYLLGSCRYNRVICFKARKSLLQHGGSTEQSRGLTHRSATSEWICSLTCTWWKRCSTCGTEGGQVDTDRVQGLGVTNDVPSFQGCEEPSHVGSLCLHFGGEPWKGPGASRALHSPGALTIHFQRLTCATCTGNIEVGRYQLTPVDQAGWLVLPGLLCTGDSRPTGLNFSLCFSPCGSAAMFTWVSIKELPCLRLHIDVPAPEVCFFL